MYTSIVAGIRFEWDENKAAANQRKHRITFQEARTVFYDEEALRLADPDHSEEEDRFLLLGVSASLRVLLVCHCYRECDDNEVIRIISARKANAVERRQYEERLAR